VRGNIDNGVTGVQPVDRRAALVRRQLARASEAHTTSPGRAVRRRDLFAASANTNGSAGVYKDMVHACFRKFQYKE
jgi:hypothetical protein